MKRFKQGMIVLIMIGMMSFLSSCSKNNTLGGDTNVDFAQVGQTSSVYINVSGTPLPATSIKVINNTDGMVTYSASVNTKAYPADLIKLLLDNLPTALAYYNPKDFDFGKKKAFPMRLQHFFASVNKAITELNWQPEFDLVSGLKDSFQNDYLVSGRDKAEIDFSVDDQILKSI